MLDLRPINPIIEASPVPSALAISNRISFIVSGTEKP
jgi:hypothetical protein